MFQTEPANYDFNYTVEEAQFGKEFGYQETRDGDQVQGSYNVLLPDGRKQIVECVVEHEGFKPIITYEGEDTNNLNASNGVSQTKKVYSLT